MSRPGIRPELRILNVVTVKATGPGSWLAGERYRRMRGGVAGEEMRRPAYTANPSTALRVGVGRAAGLCAEETADPAAYELLQALAEATQAAAAARSGCWGAQVREARRAAGLSAVGLARAAECAASTVRRIEAGTVRPNVTTLARLLAACNEKGHGSR